MSLKRNEVEQVKLDAERLTRARLEADGFEPQSVVAKRQTEARELDEANKATDHVLGESTENPTPKKKGTK